MQREETPVGRPQEILCSIVRTYIETGEPVGSRTISERRHNALSPASIRNVMAELADAGYLSQPHPSAGRVPTEKAFRSYVQSLTAKAIPAAQADRVRAALSEAETLNERIERSSRILMELTHNVGIAAALPATDQILARMELLSLGEQRVLMIVVTADHTVRDRLVTLEDAVSQDELDSIRNYVNHHFGGWTLFEARRELGRRFEEERAAYDAILRRLRVLYGKGLFATDPSAEVHMEGASNLVGLDLRLTRERMCELLQALEEKQRLLDLLDRFLELPAGELGVHVGLEEAHPAMKELALIGLNLHLPAGGRARVAVLGPLRMQYERVMSAVLYIGRTFQSF